VGLAAAILAAILAGLTFAYRRHTLLLRSETAHRKSIVESSDDAIIEEAADGRVVGWNRAAQKLFGYTPEFAIGRLTAGLIIDGDQASADGAMRAAVIGGCTVRPGEILVRTSDGTAINVSMTVFAIFGADGRIEGLCRIVRDIRQGEHAERNLLAINAGLERQAVERSAGLESAQNDLQTMLDAMPAMIAYWDRNLINRFANRAHELWIGAEPGTLQGKHVSEILGKDLLERDSRHIEAALRGEVQTFEQSMPKPDGLGYRHSLTHYVPDIANGDVRGFYVLVHDVSELTENRLRLAAAVRENEALLRTLDLHSKVVVTDDTGRIIKVNDNFCRVLGYDREELLGRSHSIVNSGVQDRAFWTQMWDTITTGRPWRGVICNRAKDGSLHWVDGIIAPFPGKDGRAEKYVSIATSITAARLTEQRLRSNEAFLDRIGSVAGVGGWEFDVETREVTWSMQSYRIHEVDPGYVPDADAEIEFYAREARPTLKEAMSECITRGTAWDLELPAVTAKGRAIWVRSIGAAELKDGKPVRLIGAIQDVTARKIIEMQLQQSSERFAIAADSAGIGVWEHDAVGDTLTWDDWMYRIYGMQRTRDAKSYGTWLNTVHPEDRERVEAEIGAAIRGARDFNSEFRIARPGGEIRYVKAASRVIRGPDGTCLRITGVNFDVTDARRAEMVARRETASLLRTVLDAASEVSIIATDEDLMIKVFNSGAERLLGFSGAEMVGVERLSRIHDSAEMEACSKSLSTHLNRRLDADDAIVEPSMLSRPHERTYVRKNGTRITVSLFVTAMHSEEGDILGYVCVAHDVTQQNRDQLALLGAMAKAEQANSAKSSFLANMSHEIRTPMNAVIGLTYLLKHTQLTTEQSSFLAKIQTASKSLLAIITNILDLSKIEAGELLVESVVFSLPDLLRDVAAVMAVHADAKGIDFVLDTPPDLPEALMGDLTRLKQILINLLSNAIRFTNRGGVKFAVRRQAQSAAGVTLSFTVTDTGIGIAPDAQAGLFAPFAQADASIGRRYGGTGLGLSIVKQLSKLLGGTVSLESTPGVGSTFTVVLTLLPAALDALAAAQKGAVVHGQGALKGIRALVVDDSDINLEVAKRILELDGVHVSLAIDGQQAVERLQADPDAFDVVFMDVQMPLLDGYEATRRIRTELGLVDLPIIAVTAGALSSERQRAEEAGMNDFICKPFDGQSLARSIAHHVHPAILQRASQTAATFQPQPPSDAPWPEIDGIDSADARSRWCGDVPLFASMLQRLFDEFSQVGLPADAEVSAAPGRHAQLMHKLRGAACMLGAKSVYELAGQTEAACVAGETDRAIQLTALLTGELDRLRDSAQPVFMAARATALEPPADSSVELTPGLVDELDEMLRQQSLAALDRFKSLSPQLLRLLGKSSYDRMCKHVENLQFEEASDDLRKNDRRRGAAAIDAS
jgi:PAS domain S-box-containing protein